MLAALALACVAFAQEPEGSAKPAAGAPPSQATEAANSVGVAQGKDPVERSAPSPRESLRPPATPLVVHDPYLSIWSTADVLTDDWPRHWTGRVHAMQSMVRIDGEPFRILGPAPDDVPPLEQVDRRVTPTRTSYAFENGAVRVELDFWAVAVPFDLALLARPLTYVEWRVASRDGAPHEVSIHFDMSAEACVERPDESVRWSRDAFEGLAALRIGASEQRVLARSGDDVRIDWGWLHVAAPAKETTSFAVLSDKVARGAFVSGDALPAEDDPRNPRAANDARPVLAFEFDVGTVDAKTPASRALIVAYDDVRSVEYLGERLGAYWRRDTREMAELLPLAMMQRSKLAALASQFDGEFLLACEKRGGARYAELAALAYRQCLGAVKLCADANGRPLAFAKDGTGGGAIASVDVAFAASPLFVLFGADLTKSLLVPLLDFASSSRWPHPFAAADLGTYPRAAGGAASGATLDAAHLEATAELVLLVASLAKAEGNAAFAARYEPTLARWAATLRGEASDASPARAASASTWRSTLDANASAKVVLALGAWAQIQDRLGRSDEAQRWRASAEAAAKAWIAAAAEGERTDSVLDPRSAWSQKPALVWDRVLALGLVPDDVLRREVAHARARLRPYGVPLASSGTSTRLDASAWTACMGSRGDLDALLAPLWNAAHDTRERVPLCDTYDTADARGLGRHARPVVGALLMPFLLDEDAWKSWFKRGPAGSSAWAPPPIEVR